MPPPYEGGGTIITNTHYMYITMNRCGHAYIHRNTVTVNTVYIEYNKSVVTHSYSLTTH